MRFSIFCVVVLVLSASGCGSSNAPAGSEGGPCYGNGTCDGALTCASDICVSLVSCAGIDCSGFGTCEIIDGTPTCNCDAGYRADGVTCVEDSVDVCSGQTCSGFGSCVDNFGTAECNCDAGYRAAGLECLFGEQSLSGNFTITENFAMVGGNPNTGAFDDVVGNPVDFVIGFNVASSIRGGGGLDDNETYVTTGPMHIEFAGAGAASLTMVAASLEGESFAIALSDTGASDTARSNVIGLEAPAYFALEFALRGAAWELDEANYPVFGPASGTCSFMLRRYITPFALTDYASGNGTCALQ